MGAKSRPADAIVLSVRNHELHHFTAFGQTDPPRTLLLGFSTGTELAGLPVGADEGFALSSDAEVAGDPVLNDPDLIGPIYKLRFDHYLDRLRREKVNYLKVLVFDAFKPHWSPYSVEVAGQEPTGQSSGVNQAYLDRLEELVRKARQRGIAICLSLFSSRMLRDPGWTICPFNALNNNTGDLSGGGSFITGSPLSQFCVVREPPAGRSFGAMSTREKLWVVQRELVTRLVQTTQRYWNVVYEICDDARGPGDLDPMTEVVDWHVTVAGWLSTLLTDHRGRRRRAIAVSASPKVRAAILDALGAKQDATGAGLVDLVQLGGGDWGGYPGSSPTEACSLRTTTDPGQALFDAAAIADGITHREVAWPGVDAALEALARRPVSAILDTDGHHLAQKLPTRWLETARDRRAHFAYRWTPTYLHNVDVAHESCDKVGALGEVCPAKGRAGYFDCVTFGFEQRLALCSVADPEERTTAFPLPPPPDPPVNASATIEGDFLRVRFEAPPVAPEAYALFIGTDPETVWEGSDLFPDPIPIALKPEGDTIRLPPITNATDLYVSVAATRGVLTSDLAPALGPLRIALSGSELVSADLVSEVETRHDFIGSITFANTSTDTWRGPEMGVLLQAQGLTGGLADLFFPLYGPNLDGRSDTVAPGARVTVDLRRIALSGAFAETYGPTRASILPYSRQPLRFRVGMARRQEIPRADSEYPEIRITPIGEPADTLPAGGPIEIRVRDPRRLATRHVPEAQELVKKGFILPLADGIDRALHLASVVATEGDPGTIIRATTELDRLVKEPGLATRVLRLAYDGEKGVHVDVDIVRLHPIDIYYAQPTRAPRRKSFALAANAAARSPLAELTGGYTLTIASSDSAIPGGETIRWQTLAAPSGGVDQLALLSGSAHETSVVTFTAELVEDAGPTDPRHSAGAVTFEPAERPTRIHVPLGDAQTHRFFIHRLSADRPSALHAEVILHAGEDGKFQRELEITLDDAADATVTVTWQVEEILVDATPAVNRVALDLQPAHLARILQFFNDVEDAKQIVDTIRDNRSYRRDTRRAYAIRPKLAQSLLAARKKLPDHRFEIVDQIEQFTGIGVDTFEDIAYTFQDDGTPVTL